MRRLQTFFGLLLAVAGLSLIGAHFYWHRVQAACSLDGDVKVAVGLLLGGTLLLPFDFSNVRAAWADFRAPKTGSGGSPSGGASSTPSVP